MWSSTTCGCWVRKQYESYRRPPPPGSPLGGTWKPFKISTDLLVLVGAGPFPPLSRSCLEPVVGRLVCSLSAWVPNRLSSLGVGRPEGTLEQFEDVALHHLLHCGRRYEWDRGLGRLLRRPQRCSAQAGALHKWALLQLGRAELPGESAVFRHGLPASLGFLLHTHSCSALKAIPDPQPAWPQGCSSPASRTMSLNKTFYLVFC